MGDMTIVREMDQNQDISIFADHCVFMRSIYLHGKTLFEHSTPKDIERITRSAGIFFGDLSPVLREYVILQVCKITDPAQDSRNNDNHTVEFLLQHYDFSAEPETKARLCALSKRLHAFREKLLPARNKLISHRDRNAIRAGLPLGAASEAEWNEFWIDLKTLVSTIHQKVLGIPFNIDEVGMLSDVDGLLKALRHASCFHELVKDQSLALRCADLDLALS